MRIIIVVVLIVVGAKLVTAILGAIGAAFVVVLHLLGYYVPDDVCRFGRSVSRPRIVSIARPVTSCWSLRLSRNCCRCIIRFSGHSLGMRARTGMVMLHSTAKIRGMKNATTI